MEPKYKRILLKLSGEALAGSAKTGLDYDIVLSICNSVRKCYDAGAEIAIVIGGGNIWRGRTGGKIDRTRSDHMGMLATVINSLAVSDCLESLGMTVRVLSAISMQQVAEPYIKNRAVRHLEKGRVVICAGGTGNPFFTTDTAAALRAAEIKADILLKATMVDGVYDKDPKIHSDAKRFDSLTFDRVFSMGLKVIDSTAATMCRDNKISMLLFDLNRTDNIFDAVMGKTVGTFVSPFPVVA
jgi:uridylate kinase